MQQWFADAQITFRDLNQARQRLLEKTDGLTSLPPHERLWHGHLYWIAKFTKIEMTLAFTRTFRIFVRAYCKTADRMFGGDRYGRYLQARRQEYEYHMAKANESESKARRLELSHFDSRLQHEAHRNPGFVPRDKDTIQ
jgi:hypothetical protein